jgi:hypothetical protein
MGVTSAFHVCLALSSAVGTVPYISEDRRATAAEIAEHSKFNAACGRRMGVTINPTVDNKVLTDFTLDSEGDRLLIAYPDLWPVAIRAGSVRTLAWRVGESAEATNLRVTTRQSLDQCRDVSCARASFEQEYQRALSLVEQRARPLPTRLDNESSVPCNPMGHVSFSYVLGANQIAGYAVGSGCAHFSRVEFKGRVEGNIAFIDLGESGSGHALVLITDSKVHWQSLDAESAPNMFSAPLRPVAMIELQN